MFVSVLSDRWTAIQSLELPLPVELFIPVGALWDGGVDIASLPRLPMGGAPLANVLVFWPIYLVTLNAFV
jgi:hypothetical protein